MGLVAGTKFWSLRLDFVAKMVSSHDTTSPRAFLQGLVAGTSPIVRVDLKTIAESFKLFQSEFAIQYEDMECVEQKETPQTKDGHEVNGEPAAKRTKDTKTTSLKAD